MTASRTFLWVSAAIAALTFVGAIIAGASMASRMRGRDDDGAKTRALLDEALEKFDKGDTAGSRALTERILAILPAEPIARANLGRIYKGQGDYARAIAEHKLAIASDPELPDLYYNVACYYALLKRKDDALAWLGLALDHGFARLEHLRGDADLDSLGGDPRFELLSRTGKLATGIPRLRFNPSARRVAIGDPFELSLVVERDVLAADQDGPAPEIQWECPGDLELVSSEVTTAHAVGAGFVTLRQTARWVVRAKRAGFFVLPEARVAAHVRGEDVVVSSDTHGIDVVSAEELEGDPVEALPEGPL